MPNNFSVINKTKIKLPSLPLLVLKNDILGEDYSLSVAFIYKNKMQELNNIYRGFDKSTNILSFPLSKKEGEIVICPVVVKKELEKFSKNFQELLGFLVIHGMLHLKGMQHSSRMEGAEKKYDQKYFYRNRLGLGNHASRGGRISKRRKKS